MGKSPGTSYSNQIINKDKQEVALGKQNVRPGCLKDKLKFKFFSSAITYASLMTCSTLA